MKSLRSRSYSKHLNKYLQIDPAAEQHTHCGDVMHQCKVQNCFTHLCLYGFQPTLFSTSVSSGGMMKASSTTHSVALFLQNFTKTADVMSWVPFSLIKLFGSSNQEKKVLKIIIVAEDVTDLISVIQLFPSIGPRKINLYPYSQLFWSFSQA